MAIIMKTRYFSRDSASLIFTPNHPDYFVLNAKLRFFTFTKFVNKKQEMSILGWAIQR